MSATWVGGDLRMTMAKLHGEVSTNSVLAGKGMGEHGGDALPSLSTALADPHSVATASTSSHVTPCSEANVKCEARIDAGNLELM